MRVFYAIKIDLSELKILQESFAKLRRDANDKEWDVLFTAPRNFHITLQFMGDRNASELDLLTQIGSDVAKGFEGFELFLSGMGAFPEIFEARVFWVGVQNKKDLQALYMKLATRLSESGLISAIESYEPHLTIGRLRNPRSLKNFLSPFIRKNFGKVKVESLGLYKSVLQGNFPKYELLQEFKF